MPDALTDAATNVARGTLIGIGIGPGDPELITVKALRYLQSAPVVAFPAGIKGRLGVAQRAIAKWLSPAQTQLPLTFPYVRDTATLAEAWHAAAATVWPYLATGQDVVFACEGDVSFYATFTYLAQALQHRYPQARVEAIPGVCSPLAAAAVLGIPLTIQGQRLAIVPALYAVTDLETVLTWADVLVLIKVSSVYADVWSVLQRLDLLSYSYVVEHATREDQVIYADLSQRPDLELSYFSLLIVQRQPVADGISQ
ncbi:MAG: precorrin-2 C(20)-methyltransferase [Cyanobacteria bacterium J06635_15]